MVKNQPKVGARIVIVGDVHENWNTDLDGKALRLLRPDVLLFVGDFGDENVEITKQVARLNMDKSVILGNHDCCYSAACSGKNFNPKKKWQAVLGELDALGDSHVGYKRRDFPGLKLSLIGARPFTKGGDNLYNKDLLSHLYNVQTMEQSAKKILDLAASAPKDHSIIFLGHNGPTGLGSKPTDICGNDFDEREKLDHGDPDLEKVLKKLREDGQSSRVPLVAFGHMHSHLLAPGGGGERKMCVFNGKNTKNPGTVYVNTAVVPRCKGTLRNFTVVELAAGCLSVLKVTETWVDVPKDGEARIGNEKVLFTQDIQKKK